MTRMRFRRDRRSADRPAPPGALRSLMLTAPPPVDVVPLPRTQSIVDPLSRHPNAFVGHMVQASEIVPRPRAIVPWLALASLAAACGEPEPEPTANDAGPSTEAMWEEARRAWVDNDVTSHRRWLDLDPGTAEGAEARRRLAEADLHYQEAIRRLRADEPSESVARAIRQGKALAPMDPALYLVLARECRDRGATARAIEYYTKYLAAAPDGADAERAREELRAMPRDSQLDTALEALESPPAPPAPSPPVVQPPSVIGPLLAGMLAGLALAALVALGVYLLRGRGVSLQRLVQDSPEFHPAVAYLVGTLRHELLKHRIGAAGDALNALAKGSATDEQLRFLRTRLYGGQPLLEAWFGHVRAFERALGRRFDPHRDRAFRGAERAIRRIVALEDGLARPSAGVVRRLERAHRELRAFDADLSGLAGDLVRTRVDEALLAQALDEVRGEYEAGRVALDDVVVSRVEDEIEIEVFRVDLVLILKNVVRNAILAVGRSEPPRRIALDVRLELLPTGEENVCLRVRDSSEEPLTTESIYDRRLDRGLGLVVAAVTRYGGGIEVEPGEGGYAKSVTVRFFRALEDEATIEGEG